VEDNHYPTRGRICRACWKQPNRAKIGDTRVEDLYDFDPVKALGKGKYGKVHAARRRGEDLGDMEDEKDVATFPHVCCVRKVIDKATICKAVSGCAGPGSFCTSQPLCSQSECEFILRLAPFLNQSSSRIRTRAFEWDGPIRIQYTQRGCSRKYGQ
jgi:hypothetical protein